MPTGYTATLMEEGQDFRTFVLTCARGMGATVMQRDDPMNEPPKLQEPSAYHVEKRAEATKLHARLNAMANDARLAYGDNLRAEAISGARKYLDRAREQNLRLDSMVEQVTAWKAPTTHGTFRVFMLQQLEMSRHDDWPAKHLKEAEGKSAMGYFSEALLQSERDIEYHTAEHEKELARTAERNNWITALYKSLP